MNLHGTDAVRRGHPWIFRGNIVARDARDLPGEPCFVRITAERGEPVGIGLYDPLSPIAIRVWEVTSNGHPDKPGGRAFADRLTRAIEIRRTLFASEPAHGKTTAYRLLNGEGDRTPGFVIDRYGDVAVLRLDGDAARSLAPLLLTEVERVLRDTGITTFLERSKRGDSASGGGSDESKVVTRFGPDRESVEVAEHGVPFFVDLVHGQKTGAFLDQRENRRRIGELVAQRRAAGAGVRVLNLFSYTGGFSQRAALAGGTVTSLDIAAKAHATAQRSFKLAGIDPRAHDFVTADAFAWLAEAKKKGATFDVVISDPPSFAPNERAKVRALTAYRALHRACADVLAPGGHLVAASCSSHVGMEDFLETLDDAALGRSDLRVLEFHGPPADHPTLPRFFEGRYLKLAVLA